MLPSFYEAQEIKTIVLYKALGVHWQGLMLPSRFIIGVKMGRCQLRLVLALSLLHFHPALLLEDQIVVKVAREVTELV